MYTIDSDLLQKATTAKDVAAEQTKIIVYGGLSTFIAVGLTLLISISCVVYSNNNHDTYMRNTSRNREEDEETWNLTPVVRRRVIQ
jgi:hypothetical protein